VVRRSLSDPTERAYYLSNAPATTLVGTLARVAGARWPIEQCFEESKGETGLDHDEVRRYDNWYRHITLALLAHTFLTDLRRREAGGKWDPAGSGPLHRLERGARPGQRAGSPTAAGGGAPTADPVGGDPPRLVGLAPAPPCHRPRLP
jgi:hypothetical protein